MRTAAQASRPAMLIWSPSKSSDGWNSRAAGHVLLVRSSLPREQLVALALLLSLSLLFIPPFQPANPPWEAATDLPVRGQVTYYAPGLMEWVYEYRLRLDQVPVCDPPACVGYVAMLRPGDLGRLVWLQPAGRFAEGPFLVVDYAARSNFETLDGRGLVAEVDHTTAQRWGMRGPLADVIVWPESPYTRRAFLPLISTGRHMAAGAAGSPSQPARVWLPVVLHTSP